MKINNCTKECDMNTYIPLKHRYYYNNNKIEQLIFKKNHKKLGKKTYIIIIT